MTWFRNILLGGILLMTIVILITTVGSEPCTEEASIFLNKMMEGDRPAVLTQFGDNTCHCQPRGGYSAFLKFESGENDNLAFLYEHKFKVGAMTAKEVPTVEKFQGSSLPWEKPESNEVDVQLSFDKKDYSPYFLPLDMAYGYPIKEADLDKFCLDPSIEFFKSTALRLRPSLEKGLVPPAPTDPNRKPEFMADYYKTMLPPEACKYLKPTDAADVITADGKPAPAAQFADKLPRLKAGVLRLVVVRRGKMQRWAIKKGTFIDPVFTLADGKELALKTPEKAISEAAAASEGAAEGTEASAAGAK